VSFYFGVSGFGVWLVKETFSNRLVIVFVGCGLVEVCCCC
jgi:hypothetical protein